MLRERILPRNLKSDQPLVWESVLLGRLFFFPTFRLKRSKYYRQDKCTGNGNKVTSWYFAQKCQEPHQHKKKKMELFIRLTFQTPSYWFLLENSLLATANRTTNKLAICALRKLSLPSGDPQKRNAQSEHNSSSVMRGDNGAKEAEYALRSQKN